MRLKDKVAIITGGGTGIGKGIAIKFAEEGASVIITGRREDVLAETSQEIESKFGHCKYFKADVSSAKEIENTVEFVKSNFGKIDILVNNAGIVAQHDTLNTTEEEWDQLMSVDLKGTWLFAKACLPPMIEQNYGKIVNIASIAGLVGFAGIAPYCAAKGGVVNLTREMALDYISKGININAIAPGVIISDMTKGILDDQNMKNAMLSQIPSGRIGTPEDIANTALFLSSDESTYIVGQTLVVDGGWTIK